MNLILGILSQTLVSCRKLILLSIQYRVPITRLGSRGMPDQVANTPSVSDLNVQKLKLTQGNATLM